MTSRAILAVFLPLGLAAGLPAAWAEPLSDPTRPPAAFAIGGEVDPATEGNNLQSIIRSNRGKPAAIINGEYVMLGGRVGEARLVKIGEDFVTLKSPTGTEILMLVQGVEKKPATDAERNAVGKAHKDRDEVRK